MSTYLIVCILIAVASIILAIVGFSIDNEVMSIFGTAFFILTLLFGFGLFGGLVPTETEKTEIEDYEIVKTDNSVIIDSEFETRTFKLMKYSDLTRDDIKVLHIRKYNSYGTKLESGIKIKEIKEESNEQRE